MRGLHRAKRLLQPRFAPVRNVTALRPCHVSGRLLHRGRPVRERDGERGMRLRRQALQPLHGQRFGVQPQHARVRGAGMRTGNLSGRLLPKRLVPGGQ